MLMIASLVIGVIAYERIPLQLLPTGFTPPFLYVSIPTVPSTPSDVEDNIVEPVESIFRTVRNVQRVRSRAESTNANFMIQFADGTNMTNAYNQVQDRLERVRGELPPEVQQWVIWKFDPDEDPMLFVGAKVLVKDVDKNAAIEAGLIKPLERLPVVSRVETWGLQPMEMTVWVDDKKANAAGVSVADLVNRLRADNYSLSAGSVEQGEDRFPLRVMGRISDIDELKAFPVGNGLKLADIATITVGRRQADEVYRIENEEGFVITIFKESGENTVDAAAQVREALVELTANGEIETEIFFDQGDVIQGSLKNLAETAMWGGLFAILILFFFLRQARMTSVTAAAIPLSMLLTITVMYFAGTSLNALSLMGLMLSVGMVVDNSIVVTEAIQRRRMLGEPISKAAPIGASEVGLAIIVATSTTVVVFLPMVLMSGSETISFYLGKIGFPVCVALIASLLVSLVFIPLALKWIDTETHQHRVGVIEKLQQAYGSALRWCLSNRGTCVVVIFGLLASMAYPFKQLSRTDKLEANINDVRIFFEFESAATFEERDQRLREYEAWVIEHREELEVRTWITRMGGLWGRPQIRIFLNDIDDRELERDEIIDRIRKDFPRLSGTDWRIGWSSPGVEQKVEVEVEGPDTDRLNEIAKAAAVRLKTVDGVLDVLVGDDDERALELRYKVEPQATQRTGISPILVGGAIDYALRGRRLGYVRHQGEDVSLWVRTDPRTTVDRKSLDDLALPSPLGGPGIPIGTLTSTEIAEGFNKIQRVNGQTRIDLQILTTREDLEQLGVEIDAALAGMQTPRGYNLKKGERFAKLVSDQEEQQFALLMAIIFVFLLMGILFESFVLPFVIVLSIPFAFLGVYWILWLTGTPWDVMAGVGLIILVGIVVNNAIVLVDRVNVLIRQAKNREEALIEAGMVRLRPIVMTALTTIGGLIPMAIGSSAIVGVPYAPLGRTVIGGLVTATILTLFVVPIFYTLLDDARNYAMRFLTASGPSPAE